MGLKLAGLRLERARASKQWKDGVFRNTLPVAPGLKGNPLPLLGEFFFSGNQRTPPGPFPVADPRDLWTHPVASGLRVTWLGHSTVLLELDGRRLLTDPVFGERASPYSFVGPKRFHPVPARLDDLPPLDAVLLSHDHFDHLCRETMARLAASQVPVVTSLGVGAHLEALGFPASRVTELDWGESAELQSSCGPSSQLPRFAGLQGCGGPTGFVVKGAVDVDPRRAGSPGGAQRQRAGRRM